MYDVIVIGAGLMGSLTARSLAARGESVLVLEARPVGHPEGSSHGTSRLFRSAHPDPFYADLAARAMPLWRSLEQESGTPLLTVTGCLDYGRERRPRELYAAVRAHGVPCELLSAQAAGERFPGMRFPTEVVFHPDAGSLDPEAAIQAGLELAIRGGVGLRVGAAVEAIEERGDRVTVSTADASHVAGRLIVAAGPWLPGLIGGALPDLRVPTLTVTEQSVFHFRRIDQDASWPILVCKGDAQFFGVPSGAEVAAPAFKIGRHDPGPATTADSRPGVPDAETGDLISSFVERWMPGLDPAPLSEDTCLYTRTLNEDFVIDRRGHITIASPCSGQGAKFAPVLGEIISDVCLETRETPPRFALAAHR